jgi:hypothetical protein
MDAKGKTECRVEDTPRRIAVFLMSEVRVFILRLLAFLAAVTGGRKKRKKSQRKKAAVCEDNAEAVGP